MLVFFAITNHINYMVNIFIFYVVDNDRLIFNSCVIDTGRFIFIHNLLFFSTVFDLYYNTT